MATLKNHECTVFDPNITERPYVELQKVVEATTPDVIALSLRNIDTTQSWDQFSYFQQFVSMLRIVKQTRPDTKIVVGGTGFSMFPQEIMMKLPEIDYGVFLEGEYSFPALLENLDHPERVSGLYFRNNKKTLFTGRSKPVDFDQLPPPPREFPNLVLQEYKKVAFSIGVQTKRGCAFRCAYCTYPFLQGRNVRRRSPKRVVDEIENLVNFYNVEEIFFVDTVFNFPLNHARKICEEIMNRKLNIKWTAWFREEYINKKFMIEARDAGCHLFEFSPDGGSQEALDVLQKDNTIRDVTKTFEIANEVDDISVVYNFMYNVPSENPKTVEDFYALLLRMMTKCWKKLEYVGLTNIRIYPYTKIYQIALKQGVINEKTDLLAPTFYNPPPMSAAYLPVKWARAPMYRLLKVLRSLSERFS